MRNRTVCVLLSTYNGEKFLREQIDSILAQIDVEVKLIVRDDGSKDETINILGDYQKQDKLVYNVDNQNLGPARSFMKLLFESPESEYYAFADQDDIWKAEKLRKATDMIGVTEEPILYCSNQIIYQEGFEKGLRFKERPKLGLVNIIFGNIISGCTMVMNRALRDIMIDIRYRPQDDILKTRMHDTWVAAVTASIGTIIYDHESRILYRIHDSNAVGVSSGAVRNRIDKTIKKLKTSELRNGRSKLANNLLLLGEHIQRNDDKKVIEDIASNNVSRIMKNQTIKKECPESRLSLFIKTLLKWN